MKALLIFPVVLVLISCSSPKTYKDTEIDPKVQLQITALNEKVISAVMQRDTAGLMALCSKGLVRKNKLILLGIAMNVGNRIEPAHYAVRNQFYLTDSDTAKATVLSSGTAAHDYQLEFRPPTKDVLVSVGVFSDSLQSLAMTVIYGRRNNEWKAEVLEFGAIQRLGKDAIDWYERSRDFYQKGSIVDAVCNLSVSTGVLKPANQYWQYPMEKTIEAYRPLLEKEIDKMGKYPLDIFYVPTHPRVIKISPTLYHGVYCPTITYQTSLTSTDSVNIVKECDAVHRQIGTRFTGLDKNNRYILYRASAKQPNTKRSKAFEFVRSTEK